MLTSLPLTHTRRLSRSISRPRTFRISGRGFSRLPHQALVALDVALHPGHQFAGGEGLGHVVVGPQPQAPDLVNVVGQGGDDDDGGCPSPPGGAAADLKAAEPREHHVHDHQGIVPGEGGLEPLGAVGVEVAVGSRR